MNKIHSYFYYKIFSIICIMFISQFIYNEENNERSYSPAVTKVCTILTVVSEIPRLYTRGRITRYLVFLILH